MIVHVVLNLFSAGWQNLDYGVCKYIHQLGIGALDDDVAVFLQAPEHPDDFISGLRSQAHCWLIKQENFRVLTGESEQSLQALALTL